MVVTMLVLGLVAGVLSGMFGIGGGLVIVPALILGFGFGPKTATGTSLFALMWPVGLLGVLEYWRRGEMQVVPGASGSPSACSSAPTSAPRSPGRSRRSTMKRLYGVFLLVVGIYFLCTARRRPAPRPRRPPAEPRPPAPGGPGRFRSSWPPDLSW